MHILIGLGFIVLIYLYIKYNKFRGVVNSIAKNAPKGGCKPEPPKFPSRQFHPSHKGIQINHLAVTLKGVMPVQQNVSPGCRRYLGEYR